MTSPYEENKNKNAADLLRFEAERHRAREVADDSKKQTEGVPSSFSKGVSKEPIHKQASLADLVRSALQHAGRNE